MDLHIIPIANGVGADKFIIYRPLAGLAFVGNQGMAALAQQLTETSAQPGQTNGAGAAAVAFLERIGFFRPDLPLPPATQGKFQPTTAVLLMTNQCQLRCTYCYAAAGNYTPTPLTPALGYAVIDYVCQMALALQRPQFDVSFHGGGEPTYAWHTLKACVAYARQQPLPSKITLTSNGVWSARQREWIAANLDSISLSVDGRPETQDRQRPFLSGRGSADIVWETIAFLDQHHVPYGIRMTATAPWEQFPQDVQYLCEHTGCRSMQVEPAFNTGRGGHEGGSQVECRAFAAAFMDAYEIALRHQRRLHYAGARLGVITSTFCTAPYQALIVNARGELVTCYEMTGDAHPLAGLSCIGRVENGQVIIDEAARSHLHRLMGERRQICQTCPCYWSCAGDCYTRTFCQGADGHLQHGTRCIMNQTITQQMLLSHIADSGGVWHR